MADETPDKSATVALGNRLRCSECESEAVVTKLGDAPRLTCHGKPLDVVGGTDSGNAP